MKRTALLFLLLMLGILFQVFPLQETIIRAANDPALPQIFLDTTYVPPTGTTITVPAGGDFQAALNNARSGDTIVLQAGATYITPGDGFVLPNKSGNDWIVIRTSNLSALPAEGTRVSPSNSAAMPKLVTPAAWPAIKTAVSAHHYRFIGIEFTVATNTSLNYDLIALGDSNQTSLDVVPHDIILDRCYLHGNATGEMTRGIALNSARTAILDSYIADFHSQSYDTQAICSWNGPGPFKIVNNYLEGAGENMLFGGADPRIVNLVPSDIEFRRNLCAKRLSWKETDPSYAGTRWVIKNLFELKNARRLLVDGNTFEYIWAAGQNGAAILFTPRNQDGSAPWSCVQDVTFTNNIVRHAAAGVLLLGTDYIHPSQQTQRVKVQNNLFDDIGGTRWGATGVLFYILDGATDVILDHNTAFQLGNIITADGSPTTAFIYRNNLTPHNSYGILGSGTGSGNATLEAYFPSSIVSKNVLIGGPASLYPAGNYFPATTTEVGFIDYAGGNYRLASNSPYKNAGTDGRDIGADIDAILAAMNGTPPPPPPPPPPTSGNEVVLYANQATVRIGNWQEVSDTTAAGGSRLHNPDAGAAKLVDAFANPSTYFELTFTAQAGVPYRLWLRGKADGDSPYNDSVFVQFSSSVDAAANAVYRIGTTSATVVNLEDCSGCGLQGWGWQDNGWGIGVMGPLLYFQNSGLQTLRVQPREDGLSIDQIVLSPQAYLNTPPGALRNDGTILPPSGGSSTNPAPTINLILPNSGATTGGTSVTITGTNFAAGATVNFGNAAASSVNVASSTTITAITPAQSTGTVNVTVTNPDGQSATLANGFTYTVAVPPPETLLLVDDFNSNTLDTSKWTVNSLYSGYTDATVPVTNRNQRLEIGALQFNTGGSHYNGIRSITAYNFTGAYASVELVQAPGSSTAADAMLTIGVDADNYYRIYVESGNLICQKKINGAKTNLFIAPYDSTNHRFMRIRHDAGTGRVLFDTAGVSSGWTQRASQTWDVAVPLTSVVFELKAGTWRSEAVQPGIVYFDNFKVARP